MAQLHGVGMTAASVAAGRAIESERPDRLFDDPWAERFLRAAGFAGTMDWRSPEKVGEGFGWFMAAVPVRTKFLDDYLRAAVERGCRQVVLLGAGLDTRALRMDWPEDARFFEVDTDGVLAFKDAVLGDDRPVQAERIKVRIDLRDDWPVALTAAGFRADAATAWIVEGLLQYLEAEDVHTLMVRVADLSAPGSALGLTVAPPRALIQQGVRNVDSGILPISAEEYHAMWKWDSPSDLVRWLADHGWQAEAFAMDERARAYGRELPQLTAGPQPSRPGLVSAIRG
jgi:methyltransferase (TIGR00027 family)